MMTKRSTHGIHRRRSRKISLRRSRSIASRFRELEENILERARARNDRARVDPRGGEGAVQLGAAAGVGDDLERGRGLADLGHPRERAESRRRASEVGYDDLVEAATMRDFGDRAAGDELALLDHEDPI